MRERREAYHEARIRWADSLLSHDERVAVAHARGQEAHKKAEEEAASEAERQRERARGEQMAALESYRAAQPNKLQTAEAEKRAKLAAVRSAWCRGCNPRAFPANLRRS